MYCTFAPRDMNRVSLRVSCIVLIIVALVRLLGCQVMHYFHENDVTLSHLLAFGDA